VVYRKGELTGGNYVTIRLFCDGLSLCPRGQTFRRDDVDMSVFCFGKRGDAELFQASFGCEFIDPRSRPKWRSSR